MPPISSFGSAPSMRLSSPICRQRRANRGGLYSPSMRVLLPVRLLRERSSQYQTIFRFQAQARALSSAAHFARHARLECVRDCTRIRPFHCAARTARPFQRADLALAVDRRRHCHCPEFGVHVQNIDAAGTPLRMANTVLTLLSAAQVREFYARGFWRDETIYAAVSAHAQRPRALGRCATAGGGTLTRKSSKRRTGLPPISLRAACARRPRRGLAAEPDRERGGAARLLAQRHVCCPSLHRDHTVGEVVELLQRMRAAAFVAEAATAPTPTSAICSTR